MHYAFRISQRFLAELRAITLALRKLLPNVSTAVIATDSLPVCTSLTSFSDTTVANVFEPLTPSNLSLVRLVLVPGIVVSLLLNEMADAVARMSHDGLVMSARPTSADIAVVIGLENFPFCMILQS